MSSLPSVFNHLFEIWNAKGSTPQFAEEEGLRWLHLADTGVYKKDPDLLKNRLIFLPTWW